MQKMFGLCKVQVGTEEHGKMLKRIQFLEDGRVRAKEARNWEIEGQKRRITWKECRTLFNEFVMGAFMAQKGLWNLDRDKMLQDRGTLPMEEGDVIREYKAMPEENFLSSWLRADGKDKEEGKQKLNWKT